MHACVSRRPGSDAGEEEGRLSGPGGGDRRAARLSGAGLGDGDGAMMRLVVGILGKLWKEKQKGEY